MQRGVRKRPHEVLVLGLVPVYSQDDSILWLSVCDTAQKKRYKSNYGLGCLSVMACEYGTRDCFNEGPKDLDRKI